jgi:hypothetical protein
MGFSVFWLEVRAQFILGAEIKRLHAGAKKGVHYFLYVLRRSSTLIISHVPSAAFELMLSQDEQCGQLF